MKKLMVMAVLMMIAAANAGYAAEAQGSDNAMINGLGQILRSPVTLLDKITDVEGSKATSAHEDVAVSDVYNLDAEVTG